MSLPQTLAGRVVLITGDRRAEDLRTALERRGAHVLHTPAMTTVPLTHDPRLVRDTGALLEAPPDLVVVTTGVGFRGWLETADGAGTGATLRAALSGARILARGRKAHGAVLAAGLDTHWVAESETTAEIREHLLAEGVAGRRVAVQHHGAGADDLDAELVSAGADVISLVVYRWGPSPDPEALVSGAGRAAAGEVDAVLFTSAPAARAWLAAAAEAGSLPSVVDRAESGHLLVAAVGPVTAAPLREVGIRPLEPDRSRLGALVRSVVRHYERL